ncbi:MAG: (2Fe-2S) ferredoxin domain-containing protein, partial [Clostridia bacterium]|nr:(2Fe-2S) ferredoxin domain-containing protein [Clostridia bacterium]
MLKSRQDLIDIRRIYEAAAGHERKILVCCGTGCMAGGALGIYAELKRIMEEKGVNCSVELEKDPH